MSMELEKINHPYLTAIRRTALSSPACYLLQHGMLKGRILDFGCGFGFDVDELKRQGYDIIGYDYYYRPEYPEGKFDTILCIYVLNVLEPYAQAEVMMNVTNLLCPHGTVFLPCSAIWTKTVSAYTPFIGNTSINAMSVCLFRVWNVMRVTSFINIIISTNCFGMWIKLVRFVVCPVKWRLFVRRKRAWLFMTDTPYLQVIR